MTFRILPYRLLYMHLKSLHIFLGNPKPAASCFLHPFSIGDVPGDGLYENFPANGDRFGSRPKGVNLPIFGLHKRFKSIRSVFDNIAEMVPDLRDRLLGLKVTQSQVIHFFSRVIQFSAGPVVERHRLGGVRIKQDNRVGGLFEQGPITVFRFP